VDDLKLRRICGVALFVLGLVFAPAILLGQTVDVAYHWHAPVGGAAVDHYNVYHIIDGGLPMLLSQAPDTSFTLAATRGVQHQIQVSGVSSTGREGPLSEPSDPISFELRQTAAGTPSAPAFKPNFPNPFNPETTIVYGLPPAVSSGGQVLLAIYDVEGHRVRRLEAALTPGWHSVIWNGTDDYGKVRSSGQYIVRLAYGGAVESWKITMLK
jgi:hypothetical protein